MRRSSPKVSPRHAGFAFVCAISLSACGKDDAARAVNPDAGSGGIDTGGTSSGNGGGGTSSGNGGVASGAGGTGSGTGGVTSGAGGARPGAGGTKSGNGGRTQGAGGSSPGDGGAKPDAGSAAAGGTSGPGSGGAPSADCTAPSLVWKTANKTNYTSYPDPGSEECIKYSGCLYEGEFAACDGKKTEAWVEAHNIVAAFPDFTRLSLHDLCLRKGDKTIVVTVVDTCGDGDCGGCCTENKGSADELIDVESYTNDRWGVGDGAIEWADLGPTKGGGCK